MLVLSRRISEIVRTARDMLVTIVDVKGNQVRLGINAPAEVTVLREELFQTDHEPLNS